MPTINIDDNQLRDLRSAISSAKPVADRMNSGDTGISQDEMRTVSSAFDKMHDVLNNV